MPKAIKVLSNNKHPQFDEVDFTPAEFSAKLADPARLSCPALIKLGFPICAVPTEPRRQLITGAKGGQLSNQRATYAVIDARTGFATGDVVGDVFLLRTDGKDLTLSVYMEIDNMLNTLLDDYEDNGGMIQMTDYMFEDCRKWLEHKLRQRRYRGDLLITRDALGHILSQSGVVIGRVGQEADQQSEAETAAAMQGMETVANSIRLDAGDCTAAVGPVVQSTPGSTVAAAVAARATGGAANGVKSKTAGKGRSETSGVKRGFFG